MAFLIFEEFNDSGKRTLRPTGEHFRLAGYNLLYRGWQRLGQPLDTGWHLSQADLIDLHFGDRERPNGVKLVIDFDPNANWRIGLIEPLDVYAFTFGDGGGAIWTTLMLRLRDVFYDEYATPLSTGERDGIIGKIPLPVDAKESVEFLYLNGDGKRGWNWGRNGMTNAAFIQGGAREYFRQFF